MGGLLAGRSWSIGIPIFYYGYWVDGPHHFGDYHAPYGHVFKPGGRFHGGGFRGGGGAPVGSALPIPDP